MREYGSEHSAIILPDGYFEKLIDLRQDITYLRCGREALMFVGKQIGDNKTILFPSYCCWSMSAPFEKLGWKVIYYRLNDDLTVDLDYLDTLLKKNNPHAILTMNFYGSADTRDAISKVKSYNAEIKVIEDFSHCTFCIKKIWNEQVDFYVSSIRKSIGVCDGAVVLSKTICNKEFIKKEETIFSCNRFEAQVNKGLYTWTNNQEEKQRFVGTIRECEGFINDFDSVHPISKKSLQMIKMVNGREIAFARRENMKHLWHLLKGKVCMVPGLERSFGGAPFSLPILVNNRDELQKSFALRGLYTQVLWEICEEAKSICSVSKSMGAYMLSVPIDQRYSWNDIEDISKIIIEEVNKYRQ